MADYRVYCMDGSGKITVAHWVEATDDHKPSESQSSKRRRSAVRDLAEKPARGQALATRPVRASRHLTVRRQLSVGSRRFLLLIRVLAR